MDFSVTQCIAAGAGILATAGLIGIARGVRNRITNKEGNINPVKLEIIPPEDPAKEYRQMGELFRLGVRPELIARLFGVGRKR